MGGAPPVARLALAFAAGTAWTAVDGPTWPIPLLFVWLLAPIPTWAGPIRRRAVWAAALLAGLVAAMAARSGAHCPPARPGPGVALTGRFLAVPRSDSAPFTRASSCGTVTVVMEGADVPAGRTVRVRGSWREGARGHWFAATGWEQADPAGDASLRWAAVRWRDGLVARIHRLYGERAPLVAAVTLARREGFDPALRDTFARTGLAHLLAISGFHVGVIAGLVLGLLGACRIPSRGARVGAAVGAWGYVALIGFPDAACRAALILAFLALAGVRGRPPARWGALGSAFLVLLVLDPGRIGSVGFQLSFAGAAGLVAWASTIARTLRIRGRGRIPEPLTLGTASGVAATLGTLPVVAWHFEQLSVVGVPATLVAGPLVAVALPGAIASVVLDFVSPGGAEFLAGGVAFLLEVLERGVVEIGDRPWVAVWTTRPTVVAALGGVALAARVATTPRIGGRARRTLTVAYVVTAVLAWPVLLSVQGRGTAELVMIDVGQGDAMALRGPTGRWLLVDAGPPGRHPSPGSHPVVRALRARGVRRLEALVLTHADLDHIGGAAAVLASFEVGAVYDPGLPAGKEDFVALLVDARARGVPWRTASAGSRLDVGGLAVDVLSPTDSMRAAGVETNEASIVLRVGYGGFEALLTGDAYKPQERVVAAALPRGVDVLKVGHHGSDTSTDPELLDRIRPSVALVSVGRRNRYGHPAPEVLGRLEQRGIEVRRTDQEGTLTLVVRPDGRYALRNRGP